MRKVSLHIAFTAILAVILPSVLWAYPSALNLVPTADILGANQLRLAYESDGHNQPYDKGNSEYLYSQIGFGGRFELGIDSYDIKRNADLYFNAKYLVASETPATPAVAIGVRNISDVSKPSYYAVSYKTIKRARVHLGVETQNSDNSLILGTDYNLGNGITLLADWQTGTGRYGTVGVFWQATPAIGINVYLARNNTAALQDTYDYIGAYVGYTIPLK